MRQCAIDETKKKTARTHSSIRFDATNFTNLVEVVIKESNGEAAKARERRKGKERSKEQEGEEGKGGEGKGRGKREKGKATQIQNTKYIKQYKI